MCAIRWWSKRMHETRRGIERRMNLNTQYYHVRLEPNLVPSFPSLVFADVTTSVSTTSTVLRAEMSNRPTTAKLLDKDAS